MPQERHNSARPAWTANRAGWAIEVSCIRDAASSAVSSCHSDQRPTPGRGFRQLLDVLVALRDDRAEHRFLLQQLPAHGPPLRTLTGANEGQARDLALSHVTRRHAGMRLGGNDALELIQQLRPRPGQQGQAVAMV